MVQFFGWCGEHNRWRWCPRIHHWRIPVEINGLDFAACKFFAMTTSKLLVGPLLSKMRQSILSEAHCWLRCDKVSLLRDSCLANGWKNHLYFVLKNGMEKPAFLTPFFYALFILSPSLLWVFHLHWWVSHKRGVSCWCGWLVVVWDIRIS